MRPSLSLVPTLALSLGLAVTQGAAAAELPELSITVKDNTSGDILSFTPTLTSDGSGKYTTADGGGAAPSFSFQFTQLIFGNPCGTGPGCLSGSSFSAFFWVDNLENEAQVFSISATVGVSPIAGPTTVGSEFGDVFFFDGNGDLTERLTTVGSDPFFRVDIDGEAVAEGGHFDFTAPGGPCCYGHILSQILYPVLGSGVARSMGVEFPGFSLSAGDRMYSPFGIFVQTPEPEASSLLAAALAALLLRGRAGAAAGRRFLAHVRLR